MKRFLMTVALGSLLAPLAGCSFHGEVDKPRTERTVSRTETVTGDRVVKDEVKYDSNGNRIEKKSVTQY